MANMRDQAGSLQEKMAEATTRVESEEGEVAVTVNVGGALENIEFANSTKHLSGAMLAQMVMETYRRAATEASRKATELMTETFGADSQTAAFLRQAGGAQAPRED